MAYSQQSVKNAFEPRCRGPWAKVQLYGGAVVYVDPLITEAVLALNMIARHWDYRASGYDNAGYGCRLVAGTNRASKHSYGIAIDREWTRNPHRRPLTTDRNLAMCRAINAVRTNNGAQVWYWGGYWSKPDAMHDEIVCFPSHLRSGINWATVAGYNLPPPIPDPPGRRAMAYTALKYIKEAPNLHPGNKAVNWHVIWLQRALNIARDIDPLLKDDGFYADRTALAVADFQNDVRKFNVPIPDRVGHFEEYTRFYLAAALENIATGKA